MNNVTVAQLQSIMPNLSREKAEFHLPYLLQSMEEFEIDSPLRQSAFLAQIAHESAEFRYSHEIWGPTEAQKHYEPPHQKAKELGNTEPGDGFKYRGHGWIQITGKENHRLVGEALEIDCVNNPDLLAEEPNTSRSSAWFWKQHKLNELADEQDFKKITQRINGGLNGYPERLNYYERAIDVLCT